MNRQHRDWCVRVLRAEFPQDGPLVEEYVGEAEHQDGEGYWDNFRTAAEVCEDFRLYREIAG